MQAAAPGEPLDGAQRSSGNISDTDRTGTHGHPVYMYRARAAQRNAAPIFRANQAQDITQRPQHRHRCVDVQFVLDVINVNCVHLPSRCSTTGQLYPTADQTNTALNRFNQGL